MVSRNYIFFTYLDIINIITIKNHSTTIKNIKEEGKKKYN